MAYKGADDRGYCMKQWLNSIAPDERFPCVLTVDSTRLNDIFMTLVEGKEYRSRQTVKERNDLFES